MAKLAIDSQIEEEKQASIFDVVVNFFKENNWSFLQHETEPILRMGYQGENGDWTCTVRTREEPSQFVFYSVCPVNIPPKKRLAIAEFLTRVNFGLIIGNFEMDLQDGEVRYKTYGIGGAENSLDLPIIGRLIFINTMTMDKYLPSIMSVVYANVSIDEAIKQIEQQVDS
ncbi:MAG: hypothetical protein DCF19_19810 [Pseudanabaena frigida]|uniref:YbjN domain-containing protein n=1 Tax=Pseudanabaena frigida TaxID=945775 RepID=A0A2W4VW66_9CYAN|nr:MAG: hypothetical protein DCF19_19810 [Pseudanabaena frigida]